MSEPFDPYYTWLGIPPGEQPPNHYRLLGIQLFETNARVIDNAADRQMLHLRSFQNGPQSAQSQRLLNEVSAARICLQDQARKAAYDGELQQKVVARPPLPITLPAAAPAPAPAFVTPDLPTAAPVLRSSGTHRPKPATGKNAAFEMIKIAVGGIAGLALAVLVLQYVTGFDMLGWSAKARKESEKIAAAAAKTPSSPTTDHKASPPTPSSIANGLPPAPVSPTPAKVSPPPPTRPTIPVVPKEDPVASTGGSPARTDVLLGKFDIRYSNATRRDYLLEPGGIITLLGTLANDDASSIPLLATPLKSRVFWHPMGSSSVGYVHWPEDGTLESISVDKNNVRFTLYPAAGSVTGLARQVEGSPAQPGSTTLGIVGRFDILYSNKTRRDYLIDQGGVVTFQGTTNPGDSGPIPPLAKPQRAWVQWHSEEGRMIGNIFWPEGPKVERIVVESDGRVQFTLYPNVGYVIGEVRKSTSPPTSPPVTVASNAPKFVDLIQETKPILWSGAEIKNGQLLTTAQKGSLATMAFDYIPRGDYDLEMDVTRTSGTDGILVGIVVDGHPCAISMDCFVDEGKGGLTGLELIDGKRLTAPGHPAVHRGPVLRTGERAKIRVAVRKGNVVLQVAGKTLFDWKGDTSKLSRNPLTLSAAGERVAIGTWQSTYTIDSLKIYPIAPGGGSDSVSTGAGKAEVTEEEMPSSTPSGMPAKNGLGSFTPQPAGTPAGGEKTPPSEVDLTLLIDTLAKGKKAQQRADAAEKIARLGKEGAPAVPQLIKSMAGVNARVREKSILALGSIGPGAKQAIPELAKRMELETVPENRGNILRAMVLIDPQSKELQKLLTRFLIGGAWTKPRFNDDEIILENRIFACEVVAYLGPDAPWAVPHLKELMSVYAQHLDSATMTQLFCSSVKGLGRIGKKDSATLAALKGFSDGKGLRQQKPNPNWIQQAREACDTALRELEQADQK